jgi:hypothetical protein
VDLPYDSSYQTLNGVSHDTVSQEETEAQYIANNAHVITYHGWHDLCAIRVVEVINDFRSLQHNIIICSASSSLGSMTKEEKSMLFYCQDSANQLLQLPIFVHADGCSEDPGVQLKK